MNIAHLTGHLPSHWNRGFTLIELMVTLAVAVVLMVVATPSFVSFQRSSELASQTNSLLAGINAARTEAMKRNMNAFVVPGGSSNNWNDGWIVFADANNNGVYDATIDFTVLTQPAMPAYFTGSGTQTAKENPAYVMYKSTGYSSTKSGGFGALTITLERNDLTGSELIQQTRRIIIAKTGRVRTCKPESSTDAQCLSSTTD